MRRSSQGFGPGAVFGLVVLFVVLLPVAMIKLIAGGIAPEMVDSLSQRLRSFLVWVSASALGEVKGLAAGLVVLVVAAYLSWLLVAVMRGDRSAGRHPKRRKVA